jgi:hypothetical protein
VDRDERTLTVRTAAGRPLVSVKLSHGAALGAAAVLLAPRATAVVALAGMLRGMRLTIEEPVAFARPEAA